MPGGFSLRNTVLPHGPDMNAYETASAVGLKPHNLEGTMAFMFETRFLQRVSHYAAIIPRLQPEYDRYGQHLRKNFDPVRR